MGLALTACDDYKEPNPPAQYNPQESVLKTDEVTVSDLLGSEAYDLQAMAEAEENITAAAISCSTLPSGFTFGAIAYVSNDDFATSYPVDVDVVVSDTENQWNVVMGPADLQDVFYNKIAKTGSQTTLKVRYLVLTYSGNADQGYQIAIVGGPKNYYGPYDLTFVPYPVVGPEMLYTPGEANGWSFTDPMVLTTDNFTTYTGYAVLSPGGFKFTSEGDWNGINYGATDEEGTLTTDGDAGNLSVPTLGLYWCNVNLEDLTYEVTYIETIGLIGDATEGAWDVSTPLTPSDDFKTWSATVTLGEGEYKFRANDAWAVNLGGTPDHLTQDGPNIPSPGAGTYTVTLNLGSVPYTCTVEAK